MDIIDFKDDHATVIGRTGTGKSFATKKSLLRSPRAVLYFNTQHEKDDLQGYTKMTKSTHIEEFKRAIKSGAKINYIPSLEEDKRDLELIWIIELLYSFQHDVIYVAVDEVHLYSKDALKAMRKVTTTGRRFKIFLIPISQRPANIHNDLLTQSGQLIIFPCNLEKGWLKRYGIPAEELEEKLFEKYVRGKTYIYMIFDFHKLSGPYGKM